MTSINKSTMERAIVGTLWGILLVYIGWSSLKIQSNATTVAVIRERVSAILERMTRVESLKETIESIETENVARRVEIWKEIHRLSEAAATDLVWRKQIEERIADLKERLDALD